MPIWLGIKQLCFRLFFLFAPLILQWHFDLNLLVRLPILFSVFSRQTSLRAFFLFLLTCWVINSVSSADTCLCQVMKIFSDRQYQPHPSFRRTPSASSVRGIQWEQVLRKGVRDSTKFRVSPHWVWTISDRSLLEWCSRNKPETGTGHFLPFISLERKAPFLPSSSIFPVFSGSVHVHAKSLQLCPSLCHSVHRSRGVLLCTWHQGALVTSVDPRSHADLCLSCSPHH